MLHNVNVVFVGTFRKSLAVLSYRAFIHPLSKKGRELIVDPYTHLKTSMIFDTTLSVVIAWSIRKTSCRLHINNKNMPLILSGLK